MGYRPPRRHAGVISEEERLLSELREQYVRGDLSFIEHGDRVMEVLKGERNTAALNDRQKFAEALGQVRYHPVPWQTQALMYERGLTVVGGGGGGKPVAPPEDPSIRSTW